MDRKSTESRKVFLPDGSKINYIHHESFDDSHAGREFSPDVVLKQDANFSQAHMPDEVTRDCAKRMHYAAFRFANESKSYRVQLWKDRYHQLRDRIIIGNQKLVFRAVQKFTALTQRSDDSIGEGYLVLIHAVAAFNPWIGIRFSTYSFTCLMRGLNRLANKYLNDQPVASLLQDVADQQSALATAAVEESSFDPIYTYLDSHDRLLTDREKYVITHRFHFATRSDSHTLKEIGDDLGISKERVRQLQLSALEKLRTAMNREQCPC